MKIKSKGAVAVCTVAIILIIAIIAVKGMNQNEEPGNINTGDPNKITEEFVQVSEDGSKVNISEQLKKTKTVAGLELTNISLIENGGLTQLLADAKNTTNSTIEELDIIITAVDKNGNALAEFEGSVYALAAGQTTTLNAAITTDIANAYDFTVKEK